MKKSIFPKLPIFIPKLMDATLTELGINLPAVLVDTSNMNWRKSLVDTLPKMTDVFIVDPATYKLVFKEATENNNYKAIGYPDMEPENLYSDASFRKEQLVKRCINDQIGKKASILITPYFYAEDTDDTKFSLNLTLVSDTIQYLRDSNIHIPLYVMIHIGNGALRRPILINHIIDRYNGDFGENIAGFFLTINDFDCERADIEVLVGMANLVFRLSEFKPVFVNRISSFGEVLCATGASGFSSGLGIGESFLIKNLQASDKEKKRKFPKRTYIPEIFDYINDEEAKKIGYKCNCGACAGTRPADEKTKKLHILYTRLEVTGKMQSLSPEKKLQFMKDRLSAGLRLVKHYQDKFGSPFKTAHIAKWITVLDTVKEWRYSREDDKELDALLREIDSEQ